MSAAEPRRKPRSRRRDAPSVGSRVLRGVLGAAVGVAVTVLLRRVTSALAPPQPPRAAKSRRRSGKKVRQPRQPRPGRDAAAHSCPARAAAAL
jgi:hypothetical protein